MRSLNGQEIADFIKERQAHQVRGLIQAHHILPKLAIIHTNHTPIVNTYLKLKQKYGADIGVEVEVFSIDQSKALPLIKKLNADSTVHGIIVQLPIPDPDQTTEILDSVLPQKDVDGLHSRPILDAATPTAILWLLAGYNVELKNKQVLILGQGRLVGLPLARMLKNSGVQVTTADRSTKDISQKVREADVVISATGVAGLIKANMLKKDAVIVDAGVATDKNGFVGDVDPAVRQRQDITITPEKGGVGPLTVCALFDNVIRAAQAQKN